MLTLSSDTKDRNPTRATPTPLNPDDADPPLHAHTERRLTLGRESSLVVAGATLAVAGVLQPARRRIQRVVDRRFNRRRHDAAQTIAAFSDRVRQQVDLEALAAEPLAVAEQTVQPTQESLWLRPPQSTIDRGLTGQLERLYALNAVW
jgi:hypothetical protein